MTKIVNYTPEQTTELVSAYKAEPTPETVETFAEKFGKTVKSVVAKLSREGVYVKAEKGEGEHKRARKAELVTAFEFAVGVELKSMHNMTVKDIEALMNFMRIAGNTDGSQ